jgi:hypothetical protein
MKHVWIKQHILFASLLSLSFGAEAEETKVLKKVELKKIAPIEMKTSLSPQLKNLNTLTVTPIQLDDVVLPQSLATQSPSPPYKEREHPFPKWDEIKPQVGQRFFPVMADGKRVYVSLYGEGFSISLDLENKLREIYKKNNSSSDAFYVDGDLADKILAELKFSKDEKLFWFLFSDPQEKIVEIGKIKRFVIKPNGAGDGVFGALGVEVEANGKADLQSLVAQGLAHIGTTSQLNPSMASAPKWSTTDIDLPRGRLLDHADYIAPRGETGSRDIKRSLEFTAEKLGEVEFIQANAEFNRKEVSDQNSFPENLYGYFLRSKNGIQVLYDFYIDTTYDQKPQSILIGHWVKGFDATLYISSTGMGDCGRFVFVKNSSATVVPVRCGSWGC